MSIRRVRSSTGSFNLSARSRSAAFVAAWLLLVGLLIGYGASQANRPSPTIAPDQVNLIDFERGVYELLDRQQPLAQALLTSAYGPYADSVIRSDHDISIPTDWEYTLPTFMVDGSFYALRESPTLRYHLWRETAPDVVLMGSSMFFMNFNRQTFFSRFPKARLIDFTMGNNTPLLTRYMVEQLDRLDLHFKPGVVVLYGINGAELADFYHPDFAHIRNVVGDEFGFNPVQDRLHRLLLDSLGMRPLREDLLAAVRQFPAKAAAVLDDLTGPAATVAPADRAPAASATGEAAACNRSEPSCALFDFENQPYKYSPYFPAALADDPAGLAAFVRKLAPAWSGQFTLHPMTEKKIAALAAVKEMVERDGARFILVKVPTSTLGYYRAPSVEWSFTQQIDAVVERLGIEFYDLTDWELTGLDDTHFVFPGQQFNPEHLNYEGSDVFTRHIIEAILTPALRAEGVDPARFQ